MTKQPRVDGKTVIRVLKRAGFVVDHIEGSHHFLYKEGLPGLVCVPMHGAEIIKAKTFASILVQADLTVDEFIAVRRGKRAGAQRDDASDAL